MKRELNIFQAESCRFYAHRLRHELGNYAVVRLRHCDGAILSMHQSGTHWLKFMLASAIADHYAIDPPRYNHANDIIGGSKDPRLHPTLPHLISSHTIAPLLLNNAVGLAWLRLPRCVILVRDIRASLHSNFKKWRVRYATTFSHFLRGDPSGRQFNSDIWWCIRFLNAWGHALALSENQFLVLRYEGLRAQPHEELAKLAAHLSLPLSSRNIDAGVEAASKSAMAERADPARPPGEINLDEDDPLLAYSDADREFVRTRLSSYLTQTFDYDYSVW